jgi:hypothetical protein
MVLNGCGDNAQFQRLRCSICAVKMLNLGRNIHELQPNIEATYEAA